MNPVMFVFGVLLIGGGFVTLIKRLHDRSVQESLVVLTHAGGRVGPQVKAVAGLIVPIVASIAAGVAFVAAAAALRL